MKKTATNNTKNPLGLSDEQQKAIGALGRGPVCVSAGAGSGKTRVLVAAYLKAVLELGIPPREVLAMTFTKKAAHEMKERLADAFRVSGREDLLREIENAWIGTIDSFCNRVLKENPIECGTDPAFSVLGEREAALLMRQTLETVLQQHEGSDRWASWTADWGEKKAHEVFRTAYSLFRSSAGDDRLFQVPNKDKDLKDARKSLVDKSAEICRIFTSPRTQPERKLSEAAGRIAEILELSGQNAWAEISALEKALGKGRIERRGEDVKAAVLELEKCTMRYLRLRTQQLSAPLKAEFLRLFFVWKELYESEKRRLSAYDFNDLLFFTYTAFSGTGPIQRALCQRYRARFKYIFVDEFQDTSRLQGRILELLRHGGNVYVVGDIQQSIYRFRQADPDVFRAFRKASVVCPLKENYRSRPGILRFVNAFFASFFGEEFQALIPKRCDENKKDPCLELICIPRERGVLLDEARVLEAAAIAQRIAQLSREGTAYRDIAILMRASTKSHFYEKELEDLKIPYYLEKGRPFHEQHEVQDLLNFLRLLEDSSAESDVAAAAVLRSPLVQLADETLYWLGQFRTGRHLPSFMDAVLLHEEVPRISEKERAKLVFFLRLLARMQQAKDSRQISEILECVVEETSYEGALLTRLGGRQALANVRKLQDMAVQADEKLSNAGAFVDWVTSLSEETGEGQARLSGEKEDVVRILTVHAAKGLEFPVVMLADMGAKQRAEDRPPFLWDDRYGFGARLKGEEGGNYDDETYADIFGTFENLRDAEDLRLFYVAMTRAKEKLVFCGTASEKKLEETPEAGSSWMDLVLRHLTDNTSEPVFRNPVDIPRQNSIPLKKIPGISEPLPSLSALQKQFDTLTKPYETLEDLTVTALTAQVAKKNHMYWKPEETDADEEEDSLPRNEYGTIFHRVMEIGVKYGMGKRLPEDLWNDLVSSLGPKEREEILVSFTSFWKSATGLELKKASKLYPELPFIFKTRHGILKGQMDLVYRLPDEGWVILDYKTNRLTSARDKEAAVKSYSWQLGLYALAFWKLYGEVPKKTVLYFTATHEAVEVGWSQNGLERLSGEMDELYRSAVAERS